MPVNYCEKCGARDCKNNHATHCDRCGVDLAPRHWVMFYKGGKLDHTHCEQCALDDQCAEYTKTRKINNSTWLKAALCFMHGEDGEQYGLPRNPMCAVMPEKTAAAIHSEMKTVGAVHDLFASRTLQAIAAREKKAKAGLSGTISPVGRTWKTDKETIKVLVFSSAGRGLATLSRGDVSFTSIWDATSKEGLRAGIQYIDGTCPELVALLVDAINGKLKLKEDTKVGFG